MGSHEGTLAILLPFVNRTSSGPVDYLLAMTPGDRLRAKREERGLTAAQLAARVERSESAVRNQENGTNGIPAGLLKKYAAALGTSVSWLLTGHEVEAPPPMLTELPVIGQVRAGMWQEVDDSRQDEHDCPMVPVSLDRRYPHARQWLREVVGDSMNARGIHEGDYAHMVDFVGAGVTLERGKVVEVTRLRDGGLLREVTLKEVEVTAGGILLWPRSTNPAWKDPIRMDLGDGQDLEVQVTGLLLNAFRRFC